MTGARKLLTNTILCVVLQASLASAQTGTNILLVSNAASQQSEEISDYYARKRAVPSDQRLRLPLPLSEEIDRQEYDAKIQVPIAQWLTAHAAQDRILYIVLAKDVPLRISGTGGQGGTVASVDSELTLLYRRLAGVPVPASGPVKNPFFLPDIRQESFTPFTHRIFDIYLVGRLDGYTVADVKSMIDRGSQPVREGTIVLDGKLELGVSAGNRWLEGAAAAVRRLPGWADRALLDTSQTTLTNKDEVFGLYTWGSNAVMATARRFGHRFVPGALAAEYVSTDARTFKEPPPDWAINDTKNPFGGSHQSLIGDFIRDGVTGTAGHVAEPFLNGTIRPDALFPSYLKGFNLIESFYAAMPSLSWQTVVVGDPLCAPFAMQRPPDAELNPPIDPETEMPQLFAARRLAILTRGGAKPEVATQVARTEVRGARKDAAGVRQAWERATTLDPDYAPAHLALALIYEQAQAWDDAIERYRRVVDTAPTNVVALNNLAFALATRANRPAEALPFAVRAYTASVQDPTVGDTLAWVHHLMGNDSLAEPLIALSAQRMPNATDVRLHAAVILANLGRIPAATEHLANALRLEPALADRADVKELQAKLRSTK